MLRLALIIILFLYGCVSYNIENIKPNEIGFNDSFINKIFTIYCEGDNFVSAKKVSLKCRKRASEFAFKQGYLYFTVLDQESGTNSFFKTYTTNNSYGYSYSHIYSSNHYYKNYTFILIKENELKNWKNYYKVLDYYVPEEKNIIQKIF